LGAKRFNAISHHESPFWWNPTNTDIQPLFQELPMTTKQPDWEAIKRAYRAGSLSVRAIGDAQGVNHATILKRAKM
jgi:hypothetical protein